MATTRPTSPSTSFVLFRLVFLMLPSGLSLPLFALTFTSISPDHYYVTMQLVRAVTHIPSCPSSTSLNLFHCRLLLEADSPPPFISSSPTGVDNLPAFKIEGAGHFDFDDMPGKLCLKMFFAEGSLRKLWRQKFRPSSVSSLVSTRFERALNLSFLGKLAPTAGSFYAAISHICTM